MMRSGIVQRLRARRDERGATAIMVGLLSLVLVTAAAFTVDLGMQRVARTDMQSLADVVALDLARELGDRSVTDLETSAPTIQTLANESRDRNTTTLGSTPTIEVELGYLDSDYEFVEMSGDDVPSAVRVQASTEVDFAFGVMQSGSATRSAVSEQTQDAACFEMGSFAAALSLGNSVLGPLADFLGLGTELSLVSYQNLLGADVSLGDIATSPTIGTPDALLAPSGVRVGDLIQGTIHALNNEPNTPANSAAITVLQGFLQANAGIDLDAVVEVADVVSVDVGDAAGLAAQLNVLELIGASLGLANGDNFLATDVPINLSSLGLGTGSISISAIQGPRYACGRVWPTPADDCPTVRAGKGACATQSQVSFTLRLNGATNRILDLGTSGHLDLTTGPISLTGGVGNAKGVLTSVDSCGPPDEYTVNVGSGLLGVRLAVPVSLNGSISVAIPNLGPITNLLGTVLSGNLLSGLIGNRQYEFRNYRIVVAINGAGTNLQVDSEGTTNTDDAHLESPTNDRSGEPVRVPENPRAPALANLAIPSNFLTGRVEVRLEYEWRSRTATVVAGIPLAPYGPWGPGPDSANGWIRNTVQAPPNSTTDNVLVGATLSDLSTLPAPLNTLGAVVSGSLNNVTTLLNDQVVDTVNETFNSTLLPLLGLSGTGADLYSVSRPLCGGPPRLTG